VNVVPKLRSKKDKHTTKARFSIVHTVAMVVIAAAIFLLGVSVGQGKITFGRDAIFHKQVAKGVPENLDYRSVEQVYDSLRKNYDGQLDNTKILDGLKEGLVKAAGDPYTDYFNPKAAKDFNDQLDGTFVGIGAELTKDATANTIVVVSPISGFPAEKAGLKPKDVIAEIDGKSAYDLSISEAVNKIRGEKGTVVKLKVIRDGKQQLDLDITREQITIPSVTSKTLDGNIGYMKISRFAEDTSKLATDAANKFKQSGVKGVVLDVRGDPGGLLDAAVDVSSLWLENQTVLTERRGGVVIRTYSSHADAPLKGIKTVVLIDAGSASASEITAGALRDNKAATLIGVKSFGKGSVQQLVNLGDDSLLKVTIARWYTPAGKNIDKQGINADKEVKFTDDDAKAGKDPQLDAATSALQ
jgi:carboxyl-terminal processing protease